MKVGIVGVGTMGSAMTKRLVEKGYQVCAVDIDSKARENARRLGAEVVDSPLEAAARSEVVLMSLPLPSDVTQVVLGSHGLLDGKGMMKTIVDMSTIDPFTSQANAASARKKGVGYVDAPVLGRPQGCGKWTLPAGGEAKDIDQCNEVLSNLAASIVHVGPTGWGNVVKLLNNMLFGAINSATAEVFAVCSAFGMDPKVFYETVANSGAATVSGLFKESGSKIVSRDFTPVFTIDLLQKDMMLGIAMAKKLGVPLFVSESNQRLNEMAKDLKLGKDDTSSVIKVYEKQMGAKSA